MIKAVKDSIRCNNYDVLLALRDWIDAIMADPKKYVAVQQVEIFKDKLEDYCQGNVDLALKIIRIATVHQYIDCQWAINAYEKDSVVRTNLNSLKITKPVQGVGSQKTTDRNNLAKEVF